MKALVLCAGFGSRLLPLTKVLPKPLLPVLGNSVLGMTLSKLVTLGIEEVAINIHYLPDRFQSIFHQSIVSKLRLNILYEPSILGIMGTLRQLLPWCKGSDLLIINGDIVSDFDLGGMMYSQKVSDHKVVFGLLNHPHEHTNSCIWASRNRLITKIGHVFDALEIELDKASPHGFACIQILKNDYLRFLCEKEEQDIMKTHTRYGIKELKAIGFIDKEAAWWDIGSQANYYSMLSALFSYAKENQLTKLNKFGLASSRFL